MPDTNFYGQDMPVIEGMEEQQVIGSKEVLEATETLQEYKRGKANLEERLIENERWYKGRYWEIIRRQNKAEKDPKNRTPEPTSAWLFNAILNKHADAMDNFPEPVVLPREKSDIQSAKELQEVVPVIMEQNEYEQTYSDNWWKKLKGGTAVTGVFWNAEKENGLGDVDIKLVDILRIFWEPGIMDIQKSKNLFITDLVDEDLLDDMYPQYKGKMTGGGLDVNHYIYDESIDTSKKVVVVDWYYKVKGEDGRTILHYCKYVNDIVLYASENDPIYRNRGYYDHGDYPLVFDVMFPEEGMPTGFGFVDICKDPQLYIDKLGGYILETAMMGSKRRFFASTSTNINKEQFLDWNEPIVDVEGEIDDTRVKEISIDPLSGHYINVLQMKIDELKETSANRDVNSGSAGSVVAASAISALQEAGNKPSRDMISASYRAHKQIVKLVIELIRQFYDEQRSFRITKPNDMANMMAMMAKVQSAMRGEPIPEDENEGTDYTFVDMDNSKIRNQPIGIDSEGNTLYRKPVFDLKIKAQKKNPFSRMEQNERAKELYSLGFFNADRAQESMIALMMMDFEGINEVREQVMQGQTLLNVAKALAQENAILKGQMMPMVEETTPDNAPQPTGGGRTLAEGVTNAQTPMTDYGTRLAQRSTPHLDQENGGATSPV